MVLQYELSFWEQDAFLRDLDLVVVGAGLVGLQTAIQLKEKEPALRIALVDRGPLPIGASTRNAGFACFGSPSELLDDLRHRPADEVWQLVEDRYRGLQRLQQRWGADTIGLEQLGGYEVFTGAEEESWAGCMEALPELNRRLQEITGLPDVFCPADNQREQQGLPGVRHLIFNRLEGQIHTGQLMRALLRRAAELELLLLTGTTIGNIREERDRVVLQTAWGWSLQADRVLLATNAFTPGLSPAAAVRPARNQVLLTAPLHGRLPQGCFHYNCGYVYFRNIGNRLLIGGGRHLDLEGERTTDLGPHHEIRRYLHGQLAEWTGRPTEELPLEQQWSGIIGEGDRKAPLIEWTGERTLIAARLGGMGVALSGRVGEQAAEMLQRG